VQTVKDKHINIEMLPEKEKKELLDFYELILKKYNIKPKDEIDGFFDKYKISLKSFKFDRDEIHVR
jgi:hypothetical protein